MTTSPPPGNAGERLSPGNAGERLSPLDADERAAPLDADERPMPLNANARAMRAFAAALVRAGVTDACISPGSRSTAAALALVQTGAIRPWVITDERAAGFFALGMARETGRPVVLLCTSGTAAANYLPAVVEAALGQVPLVVLTADRPPELRDCAAAQTIDQVRLFGSHVRWSVDAPAPSPGVDLDGYFRTLAHRAVAIAQAAPRGPVHLNLPMREPLVDAAAERARLDAAAERARLGGVDPGAANEADEASDVRVHAASGMVAPATVQALASALASRARGVIVCGPGTASAPAAAGAPEAGTAGAPEAGTAGSPEAGTAGSPKAGTAGSIARLAERLGWPVFADPLSGLRFGAHDRTRIVDAYDVLLQGEALDASWRPEAVLQLGAPTVSASLQRLLAAARAPVHVVVAAPGTWPDPLQRATDVVHADAALLCAALAAALPARRATSGWARAWCDVSTRARGILIDLLADETALFEGTVLTELVPRLPSDAVLHVGNSLPVRALDTFVGGALARGDLACACNRGANGIDGVVSTALGAAAARRAPTALVVGDLSFLHDLGALQIAARHRLPLLVIVVNNDGGGIFSFLPQAALGDTFETLFGTPHGLVLGGAVTMCGGTHVTAASRTVLAAAIDTWVAHPTFTVIEVPSERAATRALHARLIAGVVAAVGDATGAEAR